jgi:murein tripeptide amidase MpaA
VRNQLFLTVAAFLLLFFAGSSSFNPSPYIVPISLRATGLTGSSLTTGSNVPVLTQAEAPFRQSLPSEFLVVRAYYTDQQMVHDLSTWLEPWEVQPLQKSLVVGVTPLQFERLERAGFRLEIDQALTEQYTRPRILLPDQTEGIAGFPCYRTVDETFTAAESIVSAHPNLASWIDIGDSWEKIHLAAGSDIRVLRLTNAAISGSKPKLFVMASVHAREYAPAELVTRFAEYLLGNYGTDPDVTWLLDYQEFHLLLQANPDGRRLAEITQDPGYMWWRKNTNRDYCPGYPYNRGADLNRNFEFQWGCCSGSSTYTCDPTYRGQSPGSEPETQAVQNYLQSQFPDLRGGGLSDPVSENASGVFLDIHSYSELVLWPWGFTSNEPPNSADLRTLGKKFAYFNQYNPQQAYELYVTDGSTDDFAYGDLGLAAYTFEVGISFFESCSRFENSVIPENLPALLYAAKIARLPYLLPAGPDALSIDLNENAIYAGTPVQLTALIDDSRFFNGYTPPILVEPVQDVNSAEYTIDIPPWITTTVPVTYPLSVIDGAFDEPMEAVAGTIETTDLDRGRHIIYVHGQDAAGNWGAVSAIFLYVQEDLLFLPWIVR